MLARKQSCFYKAKYEAAVATANASTTSLCGKISVGGRVSTQVKHFEEKAASQASTDKPSPCVQQHLHIPATWKSTPKLSTSFKKEEPTATIKHIETSEIHRPQTSAMLTHIQDQIDHHKASYSAALAKAGTATTTPAAAVCGKASRSVSGKASALIKHFEDKKVTSTMPGVKPDQPASHVQHSSSMVFIASPKVELTATVNPPEISQVNGAEASVLQTHLRQQSSRHKGSYEAALAKANAASTSPVSNTALVSRN